MMDWEVVRGSLLILQVVVYPVLGFFIYQWRQQKGRLAQLEEQLEVSRRKLEKVEGCLSNTPSSGALHDMELGLSKVSGDVRVVAEQVAGIAEAMKRMERVLDIHGDHLLNGAKK